MINRLKLRCNPKYTQLQDVHGLTVVIINNDDVSHKYFEWWHEDAKFKICKHCKDIYTHTPINVNMAIYVVETYDILKT